MKKILCDRCGTDLEVFGRLPISVRVSFFEDFWREVTGFERKIDLCEKCWGEIKGVFASKH